MLLVLLAHAEKETLEKEISTFSMLLLHEYSLAYGGGSKTLMYMLLNCFAWTNISIPIVFAKMTIENASGHIVLGSTVLQM